MASDEQCRALKKSDAKRCPNKAKKAGFCLIHYPSVDDKLKDKIDSTWGDKAYKALETAGVLSGAIYMVELIVKAWQLVPFGEEPEMPKDYKYLAGNGNRRGLGESPPFHIAANNSPSDVNWLLARQIFDEANDKLKALEKGRDIKDSEVERIQGELSELIDKMEYSVQKYFFWLIGTRAPDDDNSD